LIAVELQPDLAEMARRNFATAGLRNCASICADLRARRIDGLAPAGFDLVMANPPYRAPHSGRESPNFSRRIARGGETTLREFVVAANRYAGDGGRVAMIFTAARSAELISELRAHRLEPKRIRFVHPRASRPASTILVEARKGGGIEATIEPALILYSAPGIYSDEMRAILRA
jgi:tRNA1Val (adenine37-N6)-methyltransferase